MTLRVPQLAIIDGDPFVRELYCDVLRDEGYCPRPFDPETLTSDDLMSGAWDAVIVDPCRDRLEIDWTWLSSLTAIPTVADVPVVIVTSIPDSACPDGWDQSVIMSKPFELDRFLQTVRTVVERA